MPTETELAYERLHVATMRSSPATHGQVKCDSRDLMLVLAQLHRAWWHRDEDWCAEACVDAIRGMRERGEFSPERLDAILRIFAPIGEASAEDLELAAVDRQAIIENVAARKAALRQPSIPCRSELEEAPHGLDSQVRA